MKVKLRQMNESLKEKGFTNRQLAKRFGISHTTINNYFSNASSFDFMHFVCSLRLYEPKGLNVRKEFVRGMIPELTPRNKLLALDVLDMCGEYELQELIIEDIRALDNKSDITNTLQKLVPLYEQFRWRSEESVTDDHFFENVKKILQGEKGDVCEFNVISDFATIYAFLGFKNYKMMEKYIQKLIPEISKISSKTLQVSFNIKVKEMQIFTALHGNEVERARELCFDIINAPNNPYDSTKAVAYCKLAESYALTDYFMAKMYIDKAIEVLGECGNKKLKIRKKKILNTLLFIKIYHNVDLYTINPEDIKDLAERAFLYIKLGKIDKAIALLKELEQKNGYLSSFQLYYMGLATGKKEYFIQSIKSFYKAQDYFYVQLPELAMACYNISKGV
ncbi:AimR family lysis-lysogeny pheromone receptor [Bacillus sp. GeD10]|uniref:AimR family lysis-lysogeny pheromone receptor n=1 Tax=Bacillus sp. GeD10 TaxID=1301086 RepID=UPI0002D23462|nr:AimR family lysis-lysogeny pheromone receptor [Bacillus sp. GeD10]CCW09023.1 Prophage helix-turn-helix protein [Bacillus sp. GeD10]